MTEKQDEILATLAAGYQTLENRQKVIEEVFSNSIIIPGSKVNNILTTTVLIGVMLCLSFCFVWYYGG
ncbi:hypothetical protein KAR91_80475 [Candidatus Pacearchaeota archaeon]|nr:hypothetical protein [Candidatus Pacearchaeota archaeon]